MGVPSATRRMAARIGFGNGEGGVAEEFGIQFWRDTADAD